jgi:hypothetical protein
MPLAERIAAVTEDVQTKRDEFRQIDPHKLAKALGVLESRRPNRNHWNFIDYAWKQSLEAYAENSDGISELAFWLKDEVSTERFETLVEKFSNLEDYCGDPQFDFLMVEERQLLEEAIAFSQLRENMENGICCVAYYDIPASGGDLLFEAAIEDDGACIDLKTPYDHRDGEFKNLDDCVTDAGTEGCLDFLPLTLATKRALKRPFDD